MDCLSLRQSQHLKHLAIEPTGLLQLRLWRGQLAGGDRIGESTGLVRTVAERLISGMPATAESDCCPASQPEGFALGIKDFEITFYADRSVMVDCNSSGGHLFS